MSIDSEKMAMFDVITQLRAENERLTAQLAERDKVIEELKNHLGWVLPMAKGYAIENHVGSNRSIVTNAEQVLATLNKGASAPSVTMGPDAGKENG